MFLVVWLAIGGGMAAVRWITWQAFAALTPVALIAAAAKDEYEPILKTDKRAAVTQQQTHEPSL